MMRNKWFGILALTLACGAASATAQSLDARGLPPEHGARVQAGIVVPLGSGGSAAERAPRLEAWSDRNRPWRFGDSGQNLPLARPVRLGLSLGENPRFLLGGRELPHGQDANGISTLGWVGIGTVAVLVVGGVLLADAFKNANN
jgi:hypothetical protein